MVKPATTEHAVHTCANEVWRTCVMYLGRTTDAQDAFQETFLRHLAYEGTFSTAEHEKAWLIRVAANVCKDLLRKHSRGDVGLEERETDPPAPPDLDTPGNATSEVMDALMKLPSEQRVAMFLTAVQGFTVPQAAEAMGKPLNTVYSLIHRARTTLKEALS